MFSFIESKRGFRIKKEARKKRDLADYARDWLGFDNIGRPLQYEW